MKRILQSLGICIVSLSTILSLQPTTEGSSPILLRVTPQVIFASSKTSISIVITIDHHPNNRVGTLEISSANYSTRSEFPVTSAKTYRFERRITDAGSYDVIAQVRRASGEVFEAKQNLLVVSGEAQSPQIQP